MSKDGKENDVISELYGQKIFKTLNNEMGELPPDNLAVVNEESPIILPEVEKLTVSLMGHQLLIVSHYGDVVVPLAPEQVQALMADWSNLSEQDKPAV